MSDQLNKPPGQSRKENPNEKIVSAWDEAYATADSEARIARFIEQKAPSILIKKEEELIKKLHLKLSPKAKEFLDEARAYVKALIEREQSLFESPLGQLKDKMMGEDFNNEGEEEEKPKKNFQEEVTEFLRKFYEEKEEGSYENIAITLWKILIAIYRDMQITNFTSKENTEERKEELGNIWSLNYFIAILKKEAEGIKSPELKKVSKDYIQDVIDTLNGPAENLVIALYAAFQKIRTDLEARKFNKIIRVPEEVQKAIDNLKRGKNSVN